MAAAYRLAGAEATIVHLNELLDERYALADFHVVNFPGGFSFGDDLGAAKVLGNKMKYKKTASGNVFIDELVRFVDDGRYILGVCNGFQALVKMGMLPNINGNYEQEATITHNDSGKFEDRWITCRKTADNRSPFLKEIDDIDLPVRHGEGKLLFCDESIRKKVLEQHLVGLTYVDRQGRSTAQYPSNPNGSQLNCAGLSDPSGRIFGLMPHPEAYLSLYNHPDWGRLRYSRKEEEGQGLALFKNIVETIKA